MRVVTAMGLATKKSFTAALLEGFCELAALWPEEGGALFRNTQLGAVLWTDGEREAAWKRLLSRRNGSV